LNTIIARIKIKEGKEDDALAALKTMAEGVEANEPGTLAYVIHKSMDDPSEIVFFEMYTDDEASKAHSTGDSMKAFQAGFADIFDVSAVKIERLERVVGVVR
jgi:quinol monooxygenase YgiN